MNTNKPSKSGQYLSTETWDAMKSAGFSEEELQADQPFGPVIFSYTRAQAIEDGVLIDVTAIARRVGFRLHTVVTCGVAAALVEQIRRLRPQDFEKYPEDKIRHAAIAATLEGLHTAIRAIPGKAVKDRIDFKAAELSLWANVGPGDNGEPVLTVMLQGED